MFNGSWSDAQRRLPAYFLESMAIVKSLTSCRPYQVMSRFPLWGKSDHLPLSYLERGNGRRAMSFMDLWKHQDLDYRLSYISGPRNVVADGGWH